MSIQHLAFIKMHYTITPEPIKGILHIELAISHIDSPTLELQLPAWRPGRYELANFAKNLLHLNVSEKNGNSLAWEKITKDRWRVRLNGASDIKVRYRYYARQMDAGGSWVDENQVYINFINCLMYAEGYLEEPCEVVLNLPENYQLACGLPQPHRHTLSAVNYYRLVDSPLFASATLEHLSYQVADSTFHIWIQGEVTLAREKLVNDFRSFTQAQVNMLGGFPDPEYHFLLQALPFQHYHGVEHWNSTVMTLGPTEKIPNELHPELIGLASHELFHVWNVIRIRPTELLPYDFTRENYFPTGYVAEGLTTYYGDLFLARSGFFTPEQFLAELTRTFNRHFTLGNTAALSLTQSSFDLWLDGYTAGVPGRKVSIYHKGALAALILDLEIRKETNNRKSLDNVVQLLWERFGKRGIGYSHEDYVQLAEEVAEKPLQDYFDECITGTAPLHQRLAAALSWIGCDLETGPVPENPGNLNIRIVQREVNEHFRKWIRVSG